MCTGRTGWCYKLCYEKSIISSPEITEIVMKDFVKGFSENVEPAELSVREREVLQLVAEG